MKDKNKKLMLIVSILVLGIGLTFAYFIVGVNILGNGGSTKLATSDLIRVKYDAGTGKLATSGLNPGHSVSKEFKVTVTPTKAVQEVTYRIFLNITSNTFEVCSDSNYNSITNDCEKDAEELIYILKDGNGNEIARGDLTNGVTGEVEVAIETKKVATETDYNYTIEIEFKDTNKDQNHNQNKTIQGEVKVEFAEPDTSDLNIMAVYVEKEDKPGKYDSVDEIPNYKILNTSKSYCEVNGTRVNGIKFNYDVSNGVIGIDKIKTKGTKCYLYFGSSSSAIMASRLNVQNIKNGIPNLKSVATGVEAEDNNGVYITDDPMYGEGAKTYYWRGAAATNHMIFDNKCWRIVRINGDGSIRLIYNGIPSGTTCPGNGNNSAVIMGASNAEKYYATSDGLANKSSYSGWTYDVTKQRTLEGTPSNAKTQTEKWFSNNISDNVKSKIDMQGKFCNDRNIGTKALSGWNDGTFAIEWSEADIRFSYAAAIRFYIDNVATLECNDGDVYNLSVGAITSDEVNLAGAGVSPNNQFYLYTGVNYWTMTPTYWNNYLNKNDVFMVNVFYMGYDGVLSNTNISVSGVGLRPVINIRSDVTFNEGSDGTETNPYIVQ